MRKRKYFTFEGVRQEVIFKESETLPGGTEVDIYEFAGDPTKDLAIYKTKKTPLQRVEGGERTVEGYISGVGKLRIGKPDGTYITFYVGGGNLKELRVDVEIGQTMQWIADKNSILVGYEVCLPPYEPGRFTDLEY
ncbi:MAG: hypothetical protein UU80_C0006G0024 [candidate division WWE3 bacterium GW2011_GWA1_41_8]|uniref:Uncharacterized protein n=1 Tax=candidate division WWE3 bacterium GW2011_GWA1_41_8 TaxID=1619103 RepID=A0A0G1AB27_UNCKA|nr:MAG: hypothetical protein UU80_C0006G0024 [candidate division WWE3 bacterium GW2011_GWA1_41_8]